MRSLRFLGDGRVEVSEVPRPEPAESQALVKVALSAVCGSERHALQVGHPLNTGHEAAGWVEQAPAGSGFAAGDRVGVSAVKGCGTCGRCRAGIEVRCVSPSVQIGMHAEYVAADTSTLRKLPEGCSFVEGVLASGDTLGVPVRGTRRAPAVVGARVLVLGLGPVGLSSVLVRSFLGCDVAAVEPSHARRELALRLGAAEVADTDQPLTGPAPDLVIEASGQPEALARALDEVERGGTVLQAAESKRAEIVPSQFVNKEISYVGSWYYASEDWPVITALVEAGLHPERLVTHQVPAEEAPGAYEAFLAGESGKVLLDWA